MAAKKNRWKLVLNKFKTLSPQKKTWYILVFVLAILSLIWAITATALLDSIRESHYELAKNIINDLNANIPSSSHETFRGWEIKGPEALSWYFASVDKTGIIYYYNAVIFAIIALPTCIFSVVTLLVNFFPKKSKEEKVLMLEQKQKKKKRKQAKKAKKAKQKAGK